MLTQQFIQNPDDLLFIFAPHPQAPYRYFNSDLGEFSEPGFIVRSHSVNFSDEEQSALKESGFTVTLQGFAQVMVLDQITCTATKCFENLNLLIRRMN